MRKLVARTVVAILVGSWPSGLGGSRTGPDYALPATAGVALIGLGAVARRWPRHVSEQGAMIWLHDAVGLLEPVFAVAGVMVIVLAHRRWKNRSRDGDEGR